MIRSAAKADASAICAIYNYIVLKTPVTFEEDAVTEEDIATRITEVQSGLPWLVGVSEGSLLGYAYASR